MIADVFFKQLRNNNVDLTPYTLSESTVFKFFYFSGEQYYCKYAALRVALSLSIWNSSTSVLVIRDLYLYKQIVLKLINDFNWNCAKLSGAGPYSFHVVTLS